MSELRIRRPARRAPPSRAAVAARAPRRRGRDLPFRRAALAVLGTEVRGLLRDRRALLLSVLLPVALYPLLFVMTQRLERVSREAMSAREVGVVLELEGVPQRIAERLRGLLADEGQVELRADEEGRAVALAAAALRESTDAREMEREALEQNAREGAHVLVHGLPSAGEPGRTLFRVYFDGASDLSNEAHGRVSRALRTLAREEREASLAALLGGDPAAALEFQTVDVASEADRSGAALGRSLPLLAVLILLTSGSYAALAAFSGEREARTLETLLVQPVKSGAIVWGKFGAVLAVGLTALALNAASVLACLAAGLGALPGSGPDAPPLEIGLARLGLSALVFLPACVLLCALLCLVCGRARTFREGQHYLLPLLLGALVPTLLATRPEVELDLFLACIPLAGPSLAARDALAGDLRLLPGALAFVTSALWSWLALARLAPLLDAERVLQDRDAESEGGLRRLQSRRALAFGFAGVLLVYLAGGLLQSLHALWGLLATLWVLLVGLAFVAGALVARRAGEPLATSLWLRMPAPQHALAALFAAPAVVWLARAGIEWQQRLLPLPSSLLREELLPPELTGLALLPRLLVFALSPAVCEELFFRGAVLSGLRRDLPAWKVLAWQALLFGAVHASIYRFAPTAALGALLALLTLRSRSLLPAILLHGAYNAVIVLSELPGFPSALKGGPLVLTAGLAALLLLALPRRHAP